MWDAGTKEAEIVAISGGDGKFNPARRTDATVDMVHNWIYNCVSFRENVRMRFLTVRELRSQSAAVWRRLANEGEIVITSNGKPVAILSAVSPENLEESLAVLRRARAVAAVDAMQRQSVAAGTHSMKPEEIQAEIAAVRRGRPK